MEGSLTELSKYRFETARSDLKVAKMLYKAKRIPFVGKPFILLDIPRFEVSAGTGRL